MPVVTATPSTPTVEQVTKGDPGGTTFGNNALEPVGFYGRTAAQTSGGAQAALGRGQASGMVATFGQAFTPANLGSAATTEATLSTVIGTTAAIQIATTDLLYINKPTSQAGLGVGNVRVTAANSLAVAFSNISASTVTPTAAEKYTVVALRGVASQTQVLTPAAVVSLATVEQQFAVPSLRAGELVQVTKPTGQAGLNIAGARVVSAGVLGVTFLNNTSAATPITPTAEAYTIWSLPGLDANSSDFLIQATVTSSPAGLLSQTAPDTSQTVTGLATTDSITGVTKPTTQAGLLVGNARVSAANVLGLQYANASAATLTPTVSEVYGLRIFRPSPAAPLVVYNATLTPVAVASQTIAEQGFTVTGLVASSAVWVNKPSFTNGLGILGVRVSAANVLAINFCNPTSAAITPPTETYVIGNFQQPVPDAGNCFVQTVSLAAQQSASLLAAIRAAIVGMGQIAGA